MSEQLSFLNGPDESKATGKFNVFFAIMPDGFAAQEILQRAGKLRADRGMVGKLRPLDHLHITLHHLADYHKAPEGTIRAALRTGGDVAAITRSFGVVFNDVRSFAGKTKPIVLTDEKDSNVELTELQKSLGLSLMKNGVQQIDKSFHPHVTMFYDQRELPLEKVSPIGWNVDELVLIKSHVGQTRYDFLGRWKLKG